MPEPIGYHSYRKPYEEQFAIPHSQPDMYAVKSAAKAQFGDTPGVEGFGIGQGTLRIYVQNAEIRSRLPATFQGVPVDFVVSGDIAAYKPPVHQAK